MTRALRIFKYSVLALYLFIPLLGCTFNPSKTTQKICQNCKQIILNSKGDYPLIAYTRVNEVEPDGLIHIYLEGDGRPWMKGIWPAKNPNSREMTALRLMAQDKYPAIYLNRPCYGYQKLPPSCSPDLWTSARYSATVVTALNSALTELAHQFPNQRWILIGHSGGGTLAMLLTQTRDDVAAILTVAANLDHKAWTETHGYLPLHESLNPIEQELLPANVLRWHLAGDRDKQVSPEITKRAADMDPQARFILKAGFDHQCCWENQWSEIIAMMRNQLTGTK